MDELEQEIQDIKDELPITLRNNFDRCVHKLKNPNSRTWAISDDSLSGVHRVDPDCKNCINNAGRFRARITNCIEQLLIQNRRN
jgi:hypothetical protein